MDRTRPRQQPLSQAAECTFALAAEQPQRTDTWPPFEIQPRPAFRGKGSQRPVAKVRLVLLERYEPGDRPEETGYGRRVARRPGQTLEVLHSAEATVHS